MRIVIDLQGAQSESRFRGIGRYSLSLTQSIAALRGKHEVLVALNGMFPETIEGIRAALDGVLTQENIRVWFAPGPVKAADPANDSRARTAALMRESFIAGLKPDVLLITSFFEGYLDDAVLSIGEWPVEFPVVSMLYDLIPLVQSELYLKPNPGYERFYQSKLAQLKKATAWLTISESSLAEACQHLALPVDRLVNISGACDPIFKVIQLRPEDKSALAQRFSIPESFLMYSGGGDVRKNLDRLIRAYASLPTELITQYPLVIAGKIPEILTQGLRNLGRTKGVPEHCLIFTGSVSDTELCQLYNLCHAYVFPSLHEGFGLPVLEAMSCGAPVIASNNSSLPEVVGMQEALFDPLNEADISAKLLRVLQDEDFRQTLIEHGNKNIAQFSWESCAQKALKLCEQVASSRASQASHAPHVSHESGRPPVSAALPDHSALIQSIIKLKPAFTDAEFQRCASMIALNQPVQRSRHLYVDISELVRHDAATGVQRVTRSILNQFLQHAPEGYTVTPIYATTNELGYHYARQFVAKFTGKADDRSDDLIETIPGDIFLGLDLQHQVTRYQSPYLSALRARGVSVYFVVYDLLPVQFPQFWPSMFAVHTEWLQVLSRFDGAICISRAVANELKHWAAQHVAPRLRPFKIGWFHLGADIDSSVPSKGLPADGVSVLAKMAARPTFLSVGTIEPRKAHHQVLDAFDQLWAQGQDANLVLVGKAGWLMDDFIKRLDNHPERNNRFFWLSGVSDEYLEKIYDSATCLMNASVGEGFGLPLIESAQHGLPIITRDIPVFREVAGNCAQYFSGEAPDAITVAVKTWLAKSTAGQTPKVADMPWLTWEQSANQLKKVIFEDDWMT